MLSRTIMSSLLATLLSGGASAKWKQFACNVSLALSLGRLFNPAQASILVCEGFDYDNTSATAEGQATNANLTSLDAQNGGTEFAGTWVADHGLLSLCESQGFRHLQQHHANNLKWHLTKLLETSKITKSSSPRFANGFLNGNIPEQIFAYLSLPPSFPRLRSGLRLFQRSSHQK